MPELLDRLTTPIEEILLPVPAPDNPNLPAGTTSLPIHPISLWPIGTVTSVLCLPGEIDRERFEAALQRVTAVWPNTAGRYSRTARAGKPGEWDFSIRLTGSPIPVSYQTIQADVAFPTGTVVQPSLDPYTSALPPSFGKPDTDSPLLSIRVTTLLPTRSTVIGVIFGHILGDGSSGNLYLSHLSHFYEHGPEAVLEPSEYPSFFPHIHLPVYPPPAEVLAEYDSGQIRPREISEVMAGYGGAAEKYEAVTVTLRRAELRALHRVISDRAGGSRLSEQDVLSGWWLSLLRRTGENPEKMVYTVNYRGMGGTHPGFPPNLRTLSANVAQMRCFPLGPSASSSEELEQISATARLVRDRLLEIRQNPESTLRWLSVPAYRLEQAAIEIKAQLLVPPEDEVMVNSNLRYDWNIAFGFPEDQTAYHTSFSTVRFLRVFQANPKKGERRGETDVELTFSVAKGGDAKAAVERVAEEDRARWMKV